MLFRSEGVAPDEIEVAKKWRDTFAKLNKKADDNIEELQQMGAAEVKNLRQYLAGLEGIVMQQFQRGSITETHSNASENSAGQQVTSACLYLKTSREFTEIKWP